MVVRRRLIIYTYSDFAIVGKCAVFAQVHVLYVFSGTWANSYSMLGQIQHTCAFEVYNMEIKVHFSL